MHLALVAWLLVSYAQAAPDANLARLAGVWQGAGTVLNQPARIEMAWTPTLDGRFMKLTFVNHMGRAEPRQRFEGHAYYRTAGDDRYRGPGSTRAAPSARLTHAGRPTRSSRRGAHPTPKKAKRPTASSTRARWRSSIA